MDSNKDLYALLGVEKNCPDYEIRKAYRKLARSLHPDKGHGPEEEERVCFCA